ncbi:MAG: hypothetical protein [Bacteriophage sp.]|nr:MAG: hypothetical protein [Bacteriophage sp.]
MSIPISPLYMDNGRGAGHVSTGEPAVVDAVEAGSDIAFGAPVTRVGDKVMQAKAGDSFYGIALNREPSHSQYMTQAEIELDGWKEGEVVGVLRDGSIDSITCEDVLSGTLATFDDNGFKQAKTGDNVVGIFKADGKKGEYAEIQTRVQFAPVPCPATATAPSNSSSSGSNSSTSSNSSAGTNTKSSK